MCDAEFVWVLVFNTKLMIFGAHRASLMVWRWRSFGMVLWPFLSFFKTKSLIFCIFSFFFICEIQNFWFVCGVVCEITQVLLFGYVCGWCGVFLWILWVFMSFVVLTKSAVLCESWKKLAERSAGAMKWVVFCGSWAEGCGFGCEAVWWLEWWWWCGGCGALKA